ncbi:MAG TPA: hypothetical protein VG076_04720 [Acidimicrobiales bacterium]|nr:hypothetical protein [Acidimicrobiales bacterium]
MRFITKKRAAAAVAALAITGGGMAAYAYFTGGSATSTSSSAHTGNVTSWSVSLGTFAGGPVYPGSGTDSATYTVTNNGNGDQALTTATATVVSGTGGAVTVSGTPHAGCLAAWYSATAGTPVSGFNASIAKNGTTTGTVSVVLNESGGNQNPCQGINPDVTVTVG